MIQTYYGYGKGKTTAAIGAAIRYSGIGKKVLFVQFLKNNDSSELCVLKSVCGTDVLCSDECYNLYDNNRPERTKALSDAYEKLLFEDVCQRAEHYGMIVLDEILDAVAFGYIDEEKFLKMLTSLKNETEIILTGHTLSEKTASVSDYISEIKAVKHPYNSGTPARKGIEY